jgi:alanine racemase
VTPVIHSVDQIEMLERAKLNGKLDVYLKVNSGMNRLGFGVDNVRLAWNALKAHPAVESVTLMTHFADADGEAGVAAQLQWFDELTQPFMEGEPPQRSLANSAALLRYPETSADWVRPGIMLYGGSPFAERSAQALGLKPAMTLASELIAVHRLQRGERIGYGFSY